MTERLLGRKAPYRLLNHKSSVILEQLFVRELTYVARSNIGYIYIYILPYHTMKVDNSFIERVEQFKY